MPLALAFVAGGLATVNPCGFSLLPALISFYLGDSSNSESAAARVVVALRLGAAVGLGIMAVFLVVGIPLVMGVSQIIRAVPWAGVLTGASLFAVGLVTLFGGHLPLRVPGIAVRAGNRDRTMLGFGAAYGVASLGCTLPIFLSVIGASLATRGAAAALVVMGFYALGMLTVVTALAIAAAVAQEGLARRLKGLVPRMHRIGGAMLTLAGLYLTYYWGRVLWGPVETLAQDPIVGQVQRVAAGLERLAAGNGIWLVGGAAATVVVGSIFVVLRRRGSTLKEARDPLG